MYAPLVMSRYDTYHAAPVSPSAMRWWIAMALFLSLLIHAGLLIYAYHRRMTGFTKPLDDKPVVARVFQMKQVAIPKIEDAGEKVAKIMEKTAPVAVKQVEIPIEKPQIQEVQVAPQITDLSKQIFTEKPRVDSAGLEALANMEAGSRTAIDKALTAANTALLTESPRISAHQPSVTTAAGDRLGSGSGDSAISVPGMKSLDDALAQTGPLHAGEKAGMPGGALFEYDSYDLRSDSLEQLRKLGMLVEKNPNATFSIEGHTDSFGSPDYNQKLSEQRAESVKAWLVNNMGIAPQRIQTRGYGNTKWLVSPDKTKEEQAANRRVEIVVKTNRK